MSVMPAAENGTDRPHPNRHALQVLSICVFVLIALSGCRRQEQTIEPPKSLEPPNVILISVDTLRRDHLGCYGYGRPASPNIDQLARSGTVFENAVSTCSWTLPAHSSMLTGLYPAFHGLQDDGTKETKDTKKDGPRSPTPVIARRGATKQSGGLAAGAPKQV